MCKRFLSTIGVMCLIMIGLLGCGNAGGNGSNPLSSQPTQHATTGSTTAFKITQVDMAVTPASIAGTACGSNITVTYTATLHAPANNPGGTAAFDYTVNNGRSTASQSLTFQPGETTKTFTFQWSGKLEPDNVYPGQGGVQVSSPNQITSPTVKPTGTCALNAPFKVTSVDLTVNPASIAGVACGTTTLFTYVATFHIAPYSPGGTIQFRYTFNNGRSDTPASVNVAAGETTKTYTFTFSSNLPADHTSPGVALVMVTSPGDLISPAAIPTGTCH